MGLMAAPACIVSHLQWLVVQDCNVNAQIKLLAANQQGVFNVSGDNIVLGLGPHCSWQVAASPLLDLADMSSSIIVIIMT